MRLEDESISKFFQNREDMDKMVRDDNWRAVSENIISWLASQCKYYAYTAEKDRNMLADIETLDTLGGFHFLWPYYFGEIQDFKGIICVVTHELSRTGAPLVLLDAMRVLKKRGYFVIVFSPEEGVMQEEFRREGIPVLVNRYLSWLDKANENEDCQKCFEIFDMIVQKADLLICNTVVCYKIINLYNGSKLPILWWIHEGSSILEKLKDALPIEIFDNVKIYFVSEYAKKSFWDCGMEYEGEILSYGIGELAQEKKRMDGVTRFLLAGTVCFRKGQDLLLEAIRRLDDEQRNKTEFYFAGGYTEKKLHETLMRFKDEYPCVKYVGEIPRERLLEMMAEMDCVVCPSRDDPLPVVATEAFALKKICICSNRTGTANFIKSGENGYVFESENVETLAKTIREVTELNKDEKEKIGTEGESVFKQYFSYDAFQNNFMKILDRILIKSKNQVEEYAPIEKGSIVSISFERLQRLQKMFLKVQEEKKKQGDEAYQDSRFLHGRIEKLQEEKGEIEERCREIQKQQSENEKLLEKMKAENEGLRKNYLAICSSKSWRYTAWIRKGLYFLRKTCRSVCGNRTYRS